MVVILSRGRRVNDQSVQCCSAAPPGTVLEGDTNTLDKFREDTVFRSQCWTKHCQIEAVVWPDRQLQWCRWIVAEGLRNRWPTLPRWCYWWWRHNMETRFPHLLALCDANHSQCASSAEFWCVLHCYRVQGQALEQTMRLPMIFYDLAVMWRHYILPKFHDRVTCRNDISDYCLYL